MTNEDIDDAVEGKAARETRLSILRARRDRVLDKGVKVEIGGSEYRCTTDETSRARLDQAALDADRSGDGWSHRWKTRDGWVELDADSLEEVRAAVAGHVAAVFARYEELEAEIMGADEPEQVALDGWP